MKRKSEAREVMNENTLNLAGLLKQGEKARFSPQIHHAYFYHQFFSLIKSGLLPLYITSSKLSPPFSLM